MKTILLAGGFATRLWPLTEKTAKPLILLAGKPIISWILESLPPEMEVIISTNAVFANDFEKWRKTYFPDRNIEVFVEDSFGENDKKGALFAISLVLQHKKIAEDLLVLAGDNYFGFSLSKFLEEFAKDKHLPLLAAYDIQSFEKAKQFGVIVPKKENTSLVESFQEKPVRPLSTLISTGCFAFPQKYLADIQEFAEKKRDDLGKIFEYFLENGKDVRYFSFSEKWFDVGSFDAYLEANVFLLDGKVHKEFDVSIAGDANISGSVFFGSNVTLLENVSVQNSCIFEGCTLQNCRITDSVLGKNTFVANVDLERKVIRDESFLMR
ncbi:NDP-sugar synthase [Candidatus Peregrinibacteria bacterium]|nr:NDP-sugar synthase [Candidatus Peregrinibacteria bacterium]